MNRIFISYSRKDQKFVHQLAQYLAGLGADIWLDIEDIRAGIKWSTAIQEGLTGCDVMIVVISPEAMASRNVEDEWQSYLDDGKPVIPILLRPATLHFQLRRIQYVDFCNQSHAAGLEMLYTELAGKGIELDPLPDVVDFTVPPVSTRPASKPLPLSRRKQPSRQIWVSLSVVVLVGLAAVGLLMLPSIFGDDEKRLSQKDVDATITKVAFYALFGTPTPTPNQTQTRQALEDHQNTQVAEILQKTLTAAPTLTPYPTYTPIPTLTPSPSPNYTQTSIADDAQRTQAAEDSRATLAAQGTQAAADFWATFDAQETQAAEDLQATQTAAPTSTPNPTAAPTLTPSPSPNYTQTSIALDARETQAAAKLQVTLDAQRTQAAEDSQATYAAQSTQVSVDSRATFAAEATQAAANMWATFDAQETQVAADLQATQTAAPTATSTPTATPTLTPSPSPDYTQTSIALDARETQAAVNLQATLDARGTQAAADLQATLAAAPTATPYPTYTPQPTFTPQPTATSTPPGATEVAVIPPQPTAETVTFDVAPEMAQLMPVEANNLSQLVTLARLSLEGNGMVRAFSPDASHIAFAGCLEFNQNYECIQEGMEVWDLITLTSLGILARSDASTLMMVNEPLVFSPNGESIYLARNGTIQAWEIASGWGSELYQLPENAAVNFSPNGTLFAYAAGDYSQVHILDTSTATEQLVIDLGFSLDMQSGFFFSNDAAILVAYSSSGTVNMWNIATGQRRSTVLNSLGGSLALSPDGKTVISGGDNGLIYRWDSVTGKEKEPLQISYETGELYTGQVWSLTYSPDGALLSVLLEDWKGRILDATTGQTLSVEEGSIYISPDNRTMLVQTLIGDNLWLLRGVGTCTVASSGAAANIRAGIGSSAAIVDQLQADQVTAAIGQSTDANGNIWWQLWGARWVSSEVVTTAGDCSSLPVVTPP